VSNVELIGEAIRVWIIMLDPRLFAVFLAAAFLLAITPGPGIFYVLTRTLTGGIQEGVLSSLGTFLGGLIHVIAAALGLSAILSTSATAFLIVKYVGAVYLIWIGIRMIWTRDREPGKRSSSGNSTRAIHCALRFFRPGSLNLGFPPGKVRTGRSSCLLG
jgi:threonine/homoserine/homoserine lactone efflux protein